MFKRLRNRFLILNMAIISVLLLSAFSIVYAFTYNQTQRNIDMRLSRTLNMGREFNAGSRSGKGDRQAADTPNTPPVPPEGFPPQSGGTEVGTVPQPQDGKPFQLALDFTIETDDNGNIQTVNSIFDIEDAVYAHITALALATKRDSGDIRFENTSWAFRRAPLETGGVRIAFLDISREKGMLQSLVFTFAGVGLLALFVIFLISRLFANRAIRPIETAWEKQNQFIADASHELKTPLTTIHTNVDVLLSHPDASISEEEKWLYYIKTEAGRMTRLTNDLLYLARLDNDRDSILKTVFSLSEAVQTVLLTMEAVVFEKKLTLADEIEEELTMAGNSDQIKQLAMILLDNAVKYTPEGGRITVRLQRADKRTLFSVANTGEPIPEEMRGKIFDRFYRADQSRARQSGGYGLGLAIAKAICLQNNAQISVSCLNGENTFLVVFSH